MDKEKKTHRMRYFVAGGFIALILGSLGFGFGTGFFKVSGVSGTANGSPQASQQVSTPAPTQNLMYNITVSESVIKYQGQVITLEALREQLLGSYTGAEVYELCDDHAIKSAYDSVKSVLDDIDVSYIEK